MSKPTKVLSDSFLTLAQFLYPLILNQPINYSDREQAALGERYEGMCKPAAPRPALQITEITEELLKSFCAL